MNRRDETPPTAAGDLAGMVEMVMRDARRYVVPDERFRVEADRLLHEERAQRIEWADVPLPRPAVAAIAFGGFEETKAVWIVRQWLDAYRTQRVPDVLVLLGPVGVGKTWAGAVAIAERGGSYVRRRDLVNLSRARWGSERDAYLTLLRRPLLVVDELGTERTPADVADAADALLDVVDCREGKPTLLMGNLSRADFLGGWSVGSTQGRYDPRMYDRLRPRGALRVVGGESLRLGQL